MVRRGSGAALLVVALLASSLIATAAPEPNPEQTGENGDCLDFNALYLTPLLQLEAIIVEGDTGYNATHDGGAAVYIDFYDSAGNHLGDSSTHPHRTPARAASGSVCVGVYGHGWPDLPAEANWTYQDGL